MNKFIAHCGLCSRREAGEWVKAGKIKVNGVVEKNPAVLVSTQDRIEYRGEVLHREVKKIYLLLNKPKKISCDWESEKKPKTVVDLIGADIQEDVYPAGKLDDLSSGLLIMTNDDGLIQKLSAPEYKIKKVYRVLLQENLDLSDMNSIKSEHHIDHIAYVDDKKNELGVELHSNDPTLLHKIFEPIGHTIIAMDLVLYGGLTKKNLPRGRYRHLTDKEVIFLKHF